MKIAYGKLFPAPNAVKKVIVTKKNRRAFLLASRLLENAAIPVYCKKPTSSQVTKKDAPAIVEDAKKTVLARKDDASWAEISFFFSLICTMFNLIYVVDKFTGQVPSFISAGEAAWSAASAVILYGIGLAVDYYYGIYSKAEKILQEIKNNLQKVQ